MDPLQPSVCLHQRILETEFDKTRQCPNRSVLEQFVTDNEKLSLSVKRNEHAWMNCCGPGHMDISLHFLETLGIPASALETAHNALEFLFIYSA